MTASPGQAAERVNPSTTIRPMSDLVRQIPVALRTSLSPSHVPDSMVAVAAIARTRAGKKLEVPVRRILAGAPSDSTASRDSVVDPRSLDVLQDRGQVVAGPLHDDHSVREAVDVESIPTHPAASRSDPQGDCLRASPVGTDRLTDQRQGFPRTLTKLACSVGTTRTIRQPTSESRRTHTKPSGQRQRSE